jgi:hypothetical protein
MNAEQITAYLAATNDAKKVEKQAQQAGEEVETAALLLLPWNSILAHLSRVQSHASR